MKRSRHPSSSLVTSLTRQRGVRPLPFYGCPGNLNPEADLTPSVNYDTCIATLLLHISSPFIEKDTIH
ncbi:hypothetical protein L345_05887, partial [Ophiophagus hannah]